MTCLRRLKVNLGKMITIDLSGPDGNAFALLGIAKRAARELELDWTKINEEMTSGDYENLLDVFMKYFGDYYELENR